MRKLLLLGGLVAVLLLGIGGTVAFADNDRRGSGFGARLNGWEEVPSQVTTGHGTFRASLENAVMRYELRYSDLEGNATAAHIHIGSRHENGGISVFLCGGAGKPACPQRSGTVEGEIRASDVDGPAEQGVEADNLNDFLRAMRAGEAYVNVHTAVRAPGGEIRGQIFPTRGRGFGKERDDD